MDTKHNGFKHLTTASELQSLMNDIGITQGHLSAVIRAAYRVEGMCEEDFSDLQGLIGAALTLAQSVQEQFQSAEALAGGVRQRLEGKPEPNDRLQAETLMQMFEALAMCGKGFSAYRLARLASILGAHAKHDPELKPVFDFWIGWMPVSLGIQTSIDNSVERASGKFSVGVVHAPGGADAVIGATSAEGRQ